jgi:heme exporter protein CcmD
MSHDPHLGFVIAAYALAFVIVAGMIVMILADYMRLKQALSLLSRDPHQDPNPENLE